MCLELNRAVESLQSDQHNAELEEELRSVRADLEAMKRSGVEWESEDARVCSLTDCVTWLRCSKGGDF